MSAQRVTSGNTSNEMGIRDLVLEFLKEEHNVESLERRVKESRARCSSLMGQIRRKVIAGEKRLLKIGRKHVLVDHPLNVGVTIEEIGLSN